MTANNRVDRRGDIIRAAFVGMSRRGYENISTAQICAAAGVSSGTFFHYFPTKVEVLVAILDQVFETTREVFEQIRSTAAHDASDAIEQWCEHVLNEASDEELPGFVAALGAVPQHDGVAAVLHSESRLIREVLTEVVIAGQLQGTVRDDLAPGRLATWLGVIGDGLLNHAVEEGPISPGELRPELADVMARLLRPE